jgi:hypothetical protein
MKALKTLLLCAALVAPAAALADQVTCESKGNKRAECDMDTRGEVRLVRQISKTTCIQDTNWGLNRSSIWVDRGCAGVFASGDSLKSGGAPSSSSRGGGNSFGDGPDEVTCESVGGRRVECDMNTSGRVVVVRQLSKTECVEDTNWGLNRSSIWVDGGCRAVFAREGAGGGRSTRSEVAREDAQYDSSGRAPQAAIRGCNEYAGQDRDGVLVSQNALRPGNWEIVLRFGDDRYVCNVTSGGQVSEFQQIN